MTELYERAAGYVVPSYQAGDDAVWYHFLHGNVPGHQIDFIYRPEVPQGRLTRQHFSHLARLMKYIEPQSNERFAFAIGNLSRDDTQYEPGHGGVAILFALRIRGAIDHAGRQDPPFAHAIAAIDRALDYPTLIESAVAFHRHVLGAAESADWYRAYVRGALEDPGAVRGVLEAYVEHFGDLPQPEESALSPAWVTGGATQPRRIVLAHEDDIAFGEVAVAAARIAAVLYRSDIRWTVISNGREDDVPNGVSIRLLARTELGPADATAVVHDFADLPDEEAGIAALLFGATPAGAPEKRTRGWREQYSEQEGSVNVELDAGRASSLPAAQRSVRRVGPSGRPAPPSVQPAVWGETGEEMRTAVQEVTIPVDPQVPVYVESPLSPPPAPVAPEPVVGPAVRAAPSPEPVTATPPPEPPPSRRTLWLIVIGCCVAAIALILVLASMGGTPAEPSSATSASPAAPPPPAPSAVSLPPAPALAPLPSLRSPSASAPSPRAPSAVPSGTASPAPPPKRRPHTPKSTVFGGSLD